ncbi:DUF3606 domain-containing protein [Azohydromonas aeria]|uniref:DUF3606 domain-containing protein n=1 Tax=Azohydromonas aeria TaxID=2590212 RepID=UPI0012F87CC2|nr:DUF3606 domain-containing protein [Azohydromonas aeria]
MTQETQAAQDSDSQQHVDVHDPAALQRWSKALGTTDEALQGAVQAVGPNIDKIKEYLGAGGMASDQEGG